MSTVPRVLAAPLAAALIICLSPDPAAGKDVPGDLELGGRIFVRETAEARADAAWLARAELASARMELRWKYEDVTTVFELEASGGDAEIRDGYLKLDLPEGFVVRGGRFKLPQSPIENQSTASLPRIDRGFLSEVLETSYQLTGRRNGLALEWRGGKKKDAWRPVARVALVQRVGLDGEPTSGELDEGLGLDVAARAGLEWKAGARTLELGVAGMWRAMVAVPGQAPERFAAGSVDAQLDWELGCQAVRVWAEVFAGRTSPLFDATPATPGDPTFVTARVLAAWRRGGLERHEWFVEPFGGFGLLEPNLDVADDLAWELSFGVAAGRWKVWRVQLMGEVTREGAGTPLLIAGSGGDLVDRDAVTLQLGATF